MATTPQAVSEVCICLRIPGTAVWAVSHSSHLRKCAEAAFSCSGRFARCHAVITQMQPFIPATKALQYSTKPKGSLLRQYCVMCADKEGKETKPEAKAKFFPQAQVFKQLQKLHDQLTRHKDCVARHRMCGQNRHQKQLACWP